MLNGMWEDLLIKWKRAEKIQMGTFAKSHPTLGITCLPFLIFRL